MRREPLWKVRLAFVGATIEAEEGPVGGGFVNVTLRAADEAAARRAAIAQAREAVAELDPDASPFWSTEEVARTRRTSPLELHLFEEDSTIRPEPLADLVELLAEADLPLQIGESSLHVPPEGPDRFGVELTYEEMAYSVRTEGWHAHFGDDSPQAVACFQWLLTPFYRLVQESQGGAPSASWIERYEAAGWTPYHPVLYRNPSDPTRWMGGGWERSYRQQNARPLSLSYERIVPEAELDVRGLPLGTVIGVCSRTFDRPMAEREEWLTAEFRFDPGSKDPPLGLE